MLINMFATVTRVTNLHNPCHKSPKKLLDYVFLSEKLKSTAQIPSKLGQRIPISPLSFSNFSIYHKLCSILNKKGSFYATQVLHGIEQEKIASLVSLSSFTTVMVGTV